METTHHDEPVRSDYPHNPVRDSEALGPTEDLDREPDGTPHGVIGLTAFFSVLLAMLVGVLLLTRETTDIAAGILLALIGIPVIVSVLRNKAERDRDQVHPSR
jgi:hypothetical protein